MFFWIYSNDLKGLDLFGRGFIVYIFFDGLRRKI